MAKKTYTAQERKKYFNSRAKKGALSKNGTPLSDFTRGVYKGKADAIHQKQVSYARRMNKDDTGDWLHQVTKS